ncbi:hypothetical protein Lal_00013495 [Lupinus albus]|nr:hypothetical protein Lal_00013495 [Lupinus albus]
MASSSRAKKQRTSVAHKKQGTSSSEANPLDLERLLANDEQRKVFTEHFLGRPIFVPKFFKEEIDLHKQMALGETVKNRDILAIGNLNLEDRLLHYFLSYIIIPKFSNHSQINDIELQLMVRTRREEREWSFSRARSLRTHLRACEERDPKVGGGVGRIREVAKNRTPILIKVLPKLDRRPNVMHAGEARDHGRMVTPSGAGTSGVDDPARGKRMVTAVGDLCKVSDQASGIGPMSAKEVRTLLRKRDRYSFSKCHKRNLYHGVDMRNDVLAGFNPGNGLARDPKVGGGVGRIREVAKNRTPILIKQNFGSSYVAMLWLKLCSNTLAQVMKQYFGSSYVAMLWLKLCSNTLAQVMKQYFGSSYVAMLWLKLCSNTLAQVM